MEMTPFIKRVAISKFLGIGFGLIFAWWLAQMATAPTTLVWGVALWILTLGALIGIIGFYTTIPFFGFALPVWLRGAWCGLWMGIVMVLMAYGQLSAAIDQMTWLPTMFHSPWWALVDMAIIGAVIDLIATRATGPTPWPESGVSGQT